MKLLRQFLLRPQILLFLVIVAAIVLRFWQLGIVPSGLTWDEAAIGYNGFAIWQDRRDEWLQLFPVSFKSFGDYKAPLAIYLNGFFTTVGGLSAVMVRLPFAISSILTILCFAYLVPAVIEQLVVPEKLLSRKFSPYLSVIAALWLTLSPWHFHYSRAGFESGLSLMFTVTSLFFLTKMFEVSKSEWKLGWGLSSMLLAVAGLYTYHSAKIALPLFLLLFAWLWRRRLSTQQVIGTSISIVTVVLAEFAGLLVGMEVILGSLALQVVQIFNKTLSLQAEALVGYWLIVGIFVLFTSLCWIFWKGVRAQVYGLLAVGGLFLSFPLIRDSVSGSGSERLAQAAFWHQGMSFGEIVSTLASNLLTQFAPQFLVMGETTTLRHGTGAWGVLLPTTFILFCFGGTFFIWSLNKLDSSWRAIKRLAGFGLLWILIGFLPAAIGSELPHSNRSLLALPGFFFVALAGGLMVLKKITDSKWNKAILGSHGETNLVTKTVLGSFLLVHLLFFITFYNYYYTVYARFVGDDFKSGYIEMLQYVEQYEKAQNGFPEKAQIVVSSHYGQPYVYALFVRKTRPIFFHSGSLSKYLFVDEVTIGDLSRTNAVVVATKEDAVPLKEADHYIFGPDGEIRFAIYVR